MFKRIENNIDFAENEDKISNYWNDIDACLLYTSDAADD